MLVQVRKRLTYILKQSGSFRSLFSPLFGNAGRLALGECSEAHPFFARLANNLSRSARSPALASLW